jgi:hypothetical protein
MEYLPLALLGGLLNTLRGGWLTKWVGGFGKTPLRLALVLPTVAWAWWWGLRWQMGFALSEPSWPWQWSALLLIGALCYLGFSLSWGDYMDQDDIPEDYIFGAARGMITAGITGALFIGPVTALSGLLWPLWWWISRKYHAVVPSSPWRPNAGEVLIGTALWFAIAVDALIAGGAP